jgi:hypothetical protein
MGCQESKQARQSKKLKGDLMTQRSKLDQSRRRESTMLHNLVHEEFRRNITEVNHTSSLLYSA